MALDLSTALAGIGAAFKGETPQFMQQQKQQQELDRRRMLEDEQLAEKRKATMFMDSATANQFLNSGDLNSVENIFKDRMNILSKIPNVDTSHTQQKLAMVMAAKGGDTQSLNQLKSMLGNEVAVGKAYGILPKAADEPSTVQALKFRAQQAGLVEGTPEYQEFMRSGGGGSMEGSSGITKYKNGVAVQYLGAGRTRVLDPIRGEITDPTEKQRVIEEAIASGPAEAGAIAAARTQATGSEERAQGIINQGQDAANSTAVLRRSLALLDRVATGGFNRVALATKKLFGVEGGDEGELSANLGKAVLSQLRATFGAAFTAKEGESLKQIEAGFGSSVDTNKRLLNNALAIAENSAQKAIRRAELRGDYETADEIEAALQFNLADIDAEFAEESPPAGTPTSGRFVYDPATKTLVPQRQ